MSIYAYIAAGLFAITFYTGSVWKAYSAGKTTVQAEWTQSKLDAEAMAEEGRLLRQKSINVIATKAVENIASNRSTLDSNIAKVENYVPLTDPMLSGCFRLFHDAAAAGKEIEYQCNGNADPVPAITVAKTTAANYAGCIDNADQVEELKGIVRALNGE